jgi:hypothetical protein
MGGEAVGGERLISIRCCRVSCIQARRCTLRLQSCVAAAGQNPNGVDAAAHSRGLRLRGCAAIPLTLLTQGAGTTTADAGSIHQAPTAISFSASFMGHQRLVGRTTQGAIRLEHKVLPGEAARFEGNSHRWLAIPTGIERLGFDLGGSWSKLSRAYRVRLQLMPQLQTQVPHPLAYDTPCLLTASCVATPSIRVDLLIFVREHRRV